MKKKLALILALTVVLSLLLPACGSQKQTLTVYTWEEMFPQSLLKGFTEQTGIEINYVNFDSNETMLAKLEAAGGGDYDFIIADDYILQQAIEKGLVSELDRSKISTWGNIDPLFQGQYYDPDDRYTVPCGAGVMELVYRPSATGFEIKGYEDLWDARLLGRVGIIENYRVVDGIVLKTQGKSFNTSDISEIRKAGEKLNALAPNIRIIKDNFLNEDLVSGEIDAALTYAAPAVMAVTEDPGLKAVLPEEGLGFGVMGGFIPSKAPNKEAAHKFIEYLNTPENAGAWYSFMGYFCTNKAGQAYLDASVKDLLIMPESMAKEDMEMIENIPGEADSAHEEVWTAFRNLCG